MALSGSESYAANGRAGLQAPPFLLPAQARREKPNIATGNPKLSRVVWFSARAKEALPPKEPTMTDTTTVKTDRDYDAARLAILQDGAKLGCRYSYVGFDGMNAIGRSALTLDELFVQTANLIVCGYRVQAFVGARTEEEMQAALRSHETDIPMSTLAYGYASR